MTTKQKEKIPLVSEKEYRRMKAICNKYERTWRNKNPEKHKQESKALITAIIKAKTPKKKITKKVEQEVKQTA